MNNVERNVEEDEDEDEPRTPKKLAKTLARLKEGEKRKPVFKAPHTPPQKKSKRP